MEYLPKSHGDHAAGWVMARRGVDVCVMGGLSWVHAGFIQNIRTRVEVFPLKEFDHQFYPQNNKDHYFFPSGMLRVDFIPGPVVGTGHIHDQSIILLRV